MPESVKFCLNCGGLFDRGWNRRHDPAYKDKPFCRAQCERAWNKKELKRAGKMAPKHGVLS